MGFSWRGNKSEAVTDGVAVVTGSDSASGEVRVNADADLRAFRKMHRWDPYLDDEKIDSVNQAIEAGDAEKEAAVEQSLLAEDSPYAEVRGAVRPTDDPEMPVNTIRAWLIGFITCTIVAACNVLLGQRSAPTGIPTNVVQLISYPMGVFLAKVVPSYKFRLFGVDMDTNPGPFNIKEHTIITMMTAAGSATSYAFDILLAQEVYYGQFFHWGFQILLVLSTQAMGFGLAGICRPFIVWPASMVWPATLVTTTVIYSLHDHAPSDPAATNGWRIGRYKFFLIVAGGIFVYEWFPLEIATFLSSFTWILWIAPNNVLVNQIFGAFSGMGLFGISFDWNTFNGFLGSPLQTPAFALFNISAGLLAITVMIAGLYFGGPSYYRYLPMVSSHNFDNTANLYNTTRILTSDLVFNETAYNEYSPLLLPSAFALSYGMSFAALVSTLTHVYLFYGSEIWARIKSSKSDAPDVHLKLMRKYREAPHWWFLGVFAISFAFGMVSALAYNTHLTWWAYIVTILIGTFFIIPVGMIQAVTNQQAGLNVITELIVSYLLPGKPVAMMMFKSYGYMISSNGLNYVSDMKIGHYMKIPPRSMFSAQLFAVVWLSLVQVATYNFLRNNIEGICTPHQAQSLTCPNATVFFNASVIWGVIGAKRMFGVGALYSWVNWFWFIGFALPAIQYLVARRYPRSIARYIFFPAIFGATGLIPPATLWYLSLWALMGITFNYFIKRRWPGWWSRYIYVLSGALDIGTALVLTLSVLALGLTNSNFPDWWGNNVYTTNLDWNAAAVSLTLPDDGSVIAI